jgi:hypothetical protein
MTIKFQIIYWRDIPAQVKVREGRNRGGKPLSQRFPVAIDEAAMRAGKTDSADYLAGWRKSLWKEQEDDLDRLVSKLEEEYPHERLQKLIDQEGWEQTDEVLG